MIVSLLQIKRVCFLKYALSHNWEVINVYSDDDWSGADINRPQFQKLIEDCKNGLINIVLCKTQSRFSRDIGSC